MTEIQKTQILEMRQMGNTYKHIATTLFIPKGTVKSFCLRAEKKGLFAPHPQQENTLCKQCGKEIVQVEKRKRRIFCSKACRQKWWNTHLFLSTGHPRPYTLSPARPVENPSPPMGMPSASTAATSATSRLATTRMPPMGNEQFSAELSYQVSLALAESLLRSGLLNDEEFLQVRTLLLEKYNPPIGILFASVP